MATQQTPGQGTSPLSRRQVDQWIPVMSVKMDQIDFGGVKDFQIASAADVTAYLTCLSNHIWVTWPRR